MQRRRLAGCPVCAGRLETTELTCTACGTGISGEFATPPLARLTPEQQTFIETFVLCRGVIRDVERALDLSYPTVRARLDAVVDALKMTLAEDEAAQQKSARRADVLRQVEAGTLTPADAVRELRRLR